MPWLLFPDQILTHSSSCSSSLPFPDSVFFSNDLIVSRCSLPHRLVSVHRVGLVDRGRIDRKYLLGSRGCGDNPPLGRFDVFYFGRACLESKPELIGLDFLESLFLRRQVPKKKAATKKFMASFNNNNCEDECCRDDGYWSGFTRQVPNWP